jgi:hypothetical protein
MNGARCGVGIADGAVFLCHHTDYNLKRQMPAQSFNLRERLSFVYIRMV